MSGAEAESFGAMVWACAFITTYESEAYLVKGLFEAVGIPCRIKSNQVPQLPLTVDGLAEIEVQVLREDLEDSLALLRDFEQGDS